MDTPVARGDNMQVRIKKTATSTKIEHIICLSVSLMFLFVSGAGTMVQSDKEGGAPLPAEPYGDIDLSGTDQLAIAYNAGTGLSPKGYIRLYDWDKDTKQYVHQWSADGIGACTLGDVDTDGNKELVGIHLEITLEKSGRKVVEVRANYLSVWEDGNPSDSPAYSLKLPATGPDDKMAIGDVDLDGDNELVLCIFDANYRRVVEIWDFTSAGGGLDATTSGPTTTISDTTDAADPSVGDGGLKVKDADNDGFAEILLGDASGPIDGHGGKVALIDGVIVNNALQYNLDYVGNRGATDETVANLDGVADSVNEIFMSGVGKVCVWRYDSDTDSYGQIWSSDYTNSGTVYLLGNDAADIDGDKSLEIIAGHNTGYTRVKGTTVWHYRMYIWAYAGSDTWTEYYTDLDGPLSGWTGTMVHGDPGGDGKAIVVYDGFVFAGTTDASGHPALKCIQKLPCSVVYGTLAIG